MAQTDSIVLGGGCFWCVEAVMLPLRGVTSVVSGYANGHVVNPTYREVCSGRTGHAEVVEVTFDPEVISLHDLLTVFFTTHDPTTLNRQGGDRGTQYRSGIYVTSEAQRAVAEAVKAEITAQGTYPDPIVTEIEPLETFYPAEDYHQDYFARNPAQPYCQAVIAPKVSKLRTLYLDKLVA
ncbi:peptide-methionine (S)-S-oxide reductase [Rubrivirga sp. SAORIC476]|uniref:peptide-methionine (S)-S-oxide reductase MsrA n=1 Tax=Rubrivirga sp. SAORIC476 TaxID=1961794 RepID=UPI000BA91963|nr:peptide-methionine (S)-S-oxide reductase MsrA [Rubrivirga sp. SAORIC476]PAP74823.1 peptide-methionine (S)-S-oxide reductase [Rubrivirga sp. SAORIC476]